MTSMTSRLTTLLLLCAAAEAQPTCPTGSYCPSAGMVLPCTCPAACPALRADYSTDATLSGTLSYWTAGTLAGRGTWSGSDIDGQGTVATFNDPSMLGTDFTFNSTPSSSLLVHDFASHTLRAVSPGGVVSTLAGPGTATPGYVDSATPSAVRFNQPRQGVRAPSGILFLAGGLNHAIRQVYPNGTTGTFAGNGNAGFTNGPQRSARLNNPIGLAMDASSALYISDNLNHAIRMVVGGQLSTLAGNGTSGFADGVGTLAAFSQPLGLAVTPSGSFVYIADRLNQRIRALNVATREVRTLAGNGGVGLSIPHSCMAAGCTFNVPYSVSLLPSGVLAVAELGGHRVRLLHPATGLTTLLGGSSLSTPGTTDGVLAVSARFVGVTSVAAQFPNASSLTVVEPGSKRLRTLACWACPAGHWCALNAPPAACAAGAWGAAAGNYSSPSCAGPCQAAPGSYCPPACGAATGVRCPSGYWCAGGVAQPVACVLNPGCAAGASSDGAPPPPPTPPQACPPGFWCPGFPSYTAVLPCTCAAACAAGNRSFDPPALVFTLTALAGSGASATVDGFAMAASFEDPSMLTVLSGRGFLVNDYAAFVLRAVTPDGLVSTLAGTAATSAYVDGVGTLASFVQLRGGVQDSSTGTLYINDQGANRIRNVSVGGVVGTFAGNGTALSSDGTLANSSFLGLCGITVDGSGVLYVTEGCFGGAGTAHKVRRVSEGRVTTLAGAGTSGFLDAVGTAARFNTLYGITAHTNGSTTTLFLADRFNHRLRALDTGTRAVRTLAGNGTGGIANGVGTVGVMLNFPTGVALTAAGTVLYFTEFNAHRVRSLRLSSGVVDTVVGSGAVGNTLGVGALATLNGPLGIVVDWEGNVVFTDVYNKVVRKALCAQCPPGSWCQQGLPTPCRAGTFDSGLGSSVLPTCSGPCPAPPGSWCPVGTGNATGAPCPPRMYCTGGAALPVNCTLPALCLGGAAWDPSASPAPTASSAASGSPSFSPDPSASRPAPTVSSAASRSPSFSPNPSASPAPTAPSAAPGSGHPVASGSPSASWRGTLPAPPATRNPFALPSVAAAAAGTGEASASASPHRVSGRASTCGSCSASSSTDSAAASGVAGASAAQSRWGGGGVSSCASSRASPTAAAAAAAAPYLPTLTITGTTVRSGSPAGPAAGAPSSAAGACPSSSGGSEALRGSGASGAPTGRGGSGGSAVATPSIRKAVSGNSTLSASATELLPWLLSAGAGSASHTPSVSQSGSSSGAQAMLTPTGSGSGCGSGTTTVGSSGSTTSTGTLSASPSGTLSSTLSIGAPSSSSSASSTATLSASPTSSPTPTLSLGSSPSASSTVTTLSSSPSGTPTPALPSGASPSSFSTRSLSPSPTASPTPTLSRGASPSTTAPSLFSNASPSSSTTPSPTPSLSIGASPSSTPSFSLGGGGFVSLGPASTTKGATPTPTSTLGGVLGSGAAAAPSNSGSAGILSGTGLSLFFVGTGSIIGLSLAVGGVWMMVTRRRREGRMGRGGSSPPSFPPSSLSNPLRTPKGARGRGQGGKLGGGGGKASLASGKRRPLKHTPPASPPSQGSSASTSHPKDFTTNPLWVSSKR